MNSGLVKSVGKDFFCQRTVGRGSIAGSLTSLARPERMLSGCLELVAGELSVTKRPRIDSLTWLIIGVIDELTS